LLEANELTVHEYDIERKNHAGKTSELGLETVAKMLGVDVEKVRAAVDPTFVKTATKKAAARKAAKKSAKKTAKRAPAKKSAKKAVKK
jgi:hypothetical protein